MTVNRYHKTLALFLCIVPIIGVIAPRSLVFIPSTIGLFAFIGYRPYFGHWPEISKKAAIICAGIIALMGLSTLWAYNPHISLDRTLRTAPVMLGAVLLISVVFATRHDLKSRLEAFFPYSLIIAGILLILDLYGGDMIYGLTHSHMEDIKPGNLSHLNRAVIVYTFCSLIGLTILIRQQPRRPFVLAIVAIITALVIYKTDSQSAQLAFATALVAALVLPYRWRGTWIVLSVIIAVFMVAAPWLAQWLFAHLAESLRTAPWINEGYAANRLEIWNFVSERVLKGPWIGYGVEATRAITDFHSDMLYHKNDKVLHPHNFTIQLWIEFGILGVSLGIAVLSYLLHQIWNYCDPATRRYPTALFAACLMAAVTGYGFWQGWLLGLLIFVVVGAIACTSKPR